MVNGGTLPFDCREKVNWNIIYKVTCVGGGGIPTINTRLLMVCIFIGMFCKHTTRIMRSLRRSSRCYWSAVDCNGRATVVEVGWWCCCLEDDMVTNTVWGNIFIFLGTIRRRRMLLLKENIKA
jgi:hypothetical protein